MQKSSTGTSSAVNMKYIPVLSTGRDFEERDERRRERMSAFVSCLGGEGEGTEVWEAREMEDVTWAWERSV